MPECLKWSPAISRHKDVMAGCIYGKIGKVGKLNNVSVLGLTAPKPELP